MRTFTNYYCIVRVVSFVYTAVRKPYLKIKRTTSTQHLLGAYGMINDKYFEYEDTAALLLRMYVLVLVPVVTFGSECILLVFDVHLRTTRSEELIIYQGREILLCTAVSAVVLIIHGVVCI